MSQALNDIRKMRAKSSIIFFTMTLFLFALILISACLGNGKDVPVFFAMLTVLMATKSVYETLADQIEQQQAEFDQIKPRN